MSDTTFGYVVGSYGLAAATPDSDPAVGIAASGSIRFQPLGMPAGTVSAAVVRDVVNGVLVDTDGTPGVRLAVGAYIVAPQFPGVPATTFQIQVTVANTVDNPVSLPDAAPIPPSPAVRFVVNEQVYLDTAAARDEAVAAAAQADADVAVTAAARDETVAARDEVRAMSPAFTLDPQDPELLIVMYPTWQVDPADPLILLVPIGAAS